MDQHEVYGGEIPEVDGMEEDVDTEVNVEVPSTTAANSSKVKVMSWFSTHLSFVCAKIECVFVLFTGFGVDEKKVEGNGRGGQRPSWDAGQGWEGYAYYSGYWILIMFFRV